MQSLPTEIVGQILEFLPASGVYAFILTNKEHYKQRMMVLKSFKREFKPIFGSDCIAPSMYTGSAVLRALLGETWSNTDIDIFTDREHVDGIYARLDGDGVVVQHEYPAHIYSVQTSSRWVLAPTTIFPTKEISKPVSRTLTWGFAKAHLTALRSRSMTPTKP